MNDVIKNVLDGIRRNVKSIGGAIKTVQALGIKVDINGQAERAFTIPAADRERFYNEVKLPAEHHARADRAMRQVADGIADLAVLVATQGEIQPDEDYSQIGKA